MHRDTELGLIDRLLATQASGAPALADDESRIPVEVYRSPARFEAEREALFRALPIIVAHASEVAAPGSFVTHDALGVPLVVTRDAAGALRAFLNVCRHRGARLADAPSGNKKALVCGYHGWTYGLDGALMHIPHAEAFPRCADRGLVPVPVEERAGFVWVRPVPALGSRAAAPMDVGAFLGPLGADLEAFDLGRHAVIRAEQVRRRFHWKLLVDAFLDGYHIKRLHRDSVSRFFLDNVYVAEAFGPHLRSAVARKGLEKVRALPRESWRFRDVLSLTYFLFPNTILVFHPDWVSRVTVFPVSLDETLVTHTMVVPGGDDSEERRAHWDKTWRLIHDDVFLREDMVAAEWVQSGLDSGANESLVCGRFEFSIRSFHDHVDLALAGRLSRP